MYDQPMPPPTGAPLPPLTPPGHTFLSPTPAAPRRSLVPWIVVAVLAVLLAGTAAALAIQTGQVSQARDQAATTAATLAATQDDLAAAKRETTDAAARASAAEIRSEKVEECARGLWSTLDSAVDEDWITAYGELSEVKAACETTLGGGGGF